MGNAVSTDVVRVPRIFSNLEFGDIRTLLIDDEPWFVGRDVASALKYKYPTKAVRDHVDEADRGLAKLDTPGGKQSFLTINESGLFSLIFSSKTSNAKEFTHWVTSEVLPSLRKTGSYSLNEEMQLCNNQIASLNKRIGMMETVIMKDAESIGALVIDCRNLLLSLTSQIKNNEAMKEREEPKLLIKNEAGLSCYSWKHNQYAKLDELTQKGWYANNTDALHFIYTRMRSQYGIHLDLIQDELARESGLRPSAIDVVYNDPEYRSIFESILKNMLAGRFRTETTDNYEVKAKPKADAPAKSVYEETVHKIQSIEEAVDLLAEKFDDKTKYNCKIYDKIYRYMEQSDKLKFSWDKASMWFSKKNRRSAHSKRELIDNSTVGTRKFIQAATEMLAS